MKLSMIFDALASGELHNLYLSEDAKSIRKDKKEVVLRAINRGLLDLYGKFNLSRKDTEFNAEENVLEYRINDDDLIEILTITTLNRELLNHKDYCLKDVKTFVLTNTPSKEQTFYVAYKAKHRLLTEQDIVKDSDIDLPMVYLNALLYFIASHAYTSIVNQLDGDLNESNRYAQKYIQEINDLQQQGVDIDDFKQQCVFYERGFV